MMQEYQVDIVILGGGIAGLWTLHLLKQKGISAVLIEKRALGGGQTLASQGMIHGGMRYALQGKKNVHSESISQMPAIWESCLQGEGELDLHEVTTLAPNQMMWSPGGLGANVAAFFASKMMRARVKPIPESEWPEVFQAYKKFKGQIYRMAEVVLDSKSLIHALHNPYASSIYQGELQQIETNAVGIDHLVIGENQRIFKLTAKGYIFMAGTGNEKAVEALKIPGKQTQRRPLRQVMIKGLSHRLYAHCITTDPRPRVTITAHPFEGSYVWYLGGLVATQGVEKTEQQAIDFAKKEMKQLFPWLAWEKTQWATWYGDRAEPYAEKGWLPEGPSLLKKKNTLIGWPTKLTFAPALAREALHTIEEIEEIESLGKQSEPALPLPPAPIGEYPWENCQWQN